MTELTGKRPKVTVYITCHNYGRFLHEAIQSVLQQTMKSWELILIDDGSKDETAMVMRKFAAQNREKIHLQSNSSPCGLRDSANKALQIARGEYFMRLDADDYLDESALYVLAGFLDSYPEIALVYPNWTYVTEKGTPMGTEWRKKIGTEVNVLDLPSHGACTMVRSRILRSVGGYDTTHAAQDGHELWLKIVNRYKVANISTPLFFYRQHHSSISHNEENLLASRRKIKRSIVNNNSGPLNPRAVAVIPAKNTYADLPNIALKQLAEKPLINYVIQNALEIKTFECVYVFTDDPRIIEHCASFQNVLCDLRPAELSSERAKLSQILLSAVIRLEEEHGVFPDIVAMLNVHTPLTLPEHIREAIDTLLLYDVDSVISTYEDIDLHFLHGKNGMKPLNPGMINRLRFEREALYVGNGAIYVTWRDAVLKNSLFDGRIGHIVMPRHLSHYIKSPEDFFVVSAILEIKSKQRNAKV